MTFKDRHYDIVVFGATGFTGRLVCDELARAQPTNRFKWAIAGRNRDKLLDVRRDLRAAVPTATPDVIIAASDERSSLDAMARRAGVVITTVGPFSLHGEPLVEACVAAGTDYLDIAGEPDFWIPLSARYHDRATRSGSICVSCCGFDSVPADLGALFTIKQLGGSGPFTVEAFLLAHARFSGGTWQSALGAMAGARKSPRGLGADDGRRRPYFEPLVDRWVVPMPVIDPLVVARSAELRGDYGTGFRYGQYLQTGSMIQLGGLMFAIGTVTGLAQFRPTRRLLSRVRSSGEGPSIEQRERSWFRVSLRGPRVFARR